MAKRAWLTLLSGGAIFVLLAGGVLAGAAWVREHATQSRGASARAISGNEALWRSSSDDDWQLLNATAAIHEGDEISTELGTVVWVTLFDGSTLEITENSHLIFSRLRESRFSDATQQVKIDLVHGSVYASLAPASANAYGELEIVSELGTAVASSVRSHHSSTSASFLIEVREPSLNPTYQFRAVAFRGEVNIQVEGPNFELVGPEQVLLSNDGYLERSSTIASEMIANGSFGDSLESWEPFYSAEGREPESSIGTMAAVEIPESDAESGATSALELRRTTSTIWARTGVRQILDQTLRLPAVLVLSFDVKLEQQGEPLGGRATIPLALELDYVDILGQERSWTAAYVIRNDEGVQSADAVSTVRAGEWTRIIVDLQNLEPIPRTLRTLVVYASGSGYESFLTNLSLTVGEGVAVR